MTRLYLCLQWNGKFSSSPVQTFPLMTVVFVCKGYKKIVVEPKWAKSLLVSNLCTCMCYRISRNLMLSFFFYYHASPFCFMVHAERRRPFDPNAVFFFFFDRTNFRKIVPRLGLLNWYSFSNWIRHYWLFVSLLPSRRLSAKKVNHTPNTSSSRGGARQKH
jgi:hypothetical protein